VLFAMAIYYVLYSFLYAVLVDLVAQSGLLPASLAPIPVMCVVVPVHFLCSRFLVLRIGSIRRDGESSGSGTLRTRP
jgi:hypothetical protein